jgi:hypothetical protein
VWLFPQHLEEKIFSARGAFAFLVGGERVLPEL